MVKDNSHPKIVNFSLDILSEYLKGNCKYDQQEDQRELCLTLKCLDYPIFRLDSHKRLVSTVLMKNGYWLYCGFVFFKAKHNHKILKHFSLHFFDENSPLFRAEWACLDIPESKLHAQPHWHLDAKVDIDGLTNPEKISSFDVFQKQQAVESPSTADLGRAHLFMNWNLENDQGAPYLDFRNESVFRKWLTNTMAYINVELQAITKR